MTQEIDILEQSLAMRAQGRPFALATVVRCTPPTSAKPGAKALILPCGHISGWIGGGCVQPTVKRVAKRAIEEDKTYLVRIAPDGQSVEDEHYLEFAMTCSSQGTLEILVEPILPQPWLLVLGKSPVARAIPFFAARVGFSVAVAFPGLEADAVPGANRVIDGWSLPPEIGRPVFVVVATQGERDEEALAAAAALNPRHLALVASEKKFIKLKIALLEGGTSPDMVRSISAPAGVDIGAVTAEEIALSVVAGLVRDRRTKATPAPAPYLPVAQPADTGSAIDPVCGMTVGTQFAKHKTEWMGAEHYFCCEGCLSAFRENPTKYAPAVG
ncbi:MAG: XdhC family protein [Pseudomonadota bacterium]|jgi:xanthine dehydrogenase accessory factor